LKVPDKVEMALRQRDGEEMFFLLNHQTTPIRLTFHQPMHDYLTGNTFSGNYELQPHSVLVLNEQAAPAAEDEPSESQEAEEAVKA